MGITLVRSCVDIYSTPRTRPDISLHTKSCLVPPKGKIFKQSTTQHQFTRLRILNHIMADEKGPNSLSEVGVAIIDEKSPLISVQLGDSSNSGDKSNFPANSSKRNQNGITTGNYTQTRKPFNLNSFKKAIVSSLEYWDLAAKFNRYRYISRLSNHNVIIPSHLLPSQSVVTKERNEKQSSLVTIFSIWNTMMGTSLLSMPWAINQAGFVLGTILVIVMAGIIFYTCYLIIKCSQEKVEHGDVVEFSALCREYLGKPGELIAVLFSVAPLVSAVIVFWVLMSNFLFNSGKYIQENIFSVALVINSSTTLEVLCPGGYSAGVTSSNSSVIQDENSFWHVQHTVPYLLIVVFFPLCSVRSPTFFTKFNSLGTVSAIYIIIFTIIKASIWGVNLDFNKIPMFKASFPALTGLLTLAYLIHNCILSIMRNQENPKNNERDLSVAFCLVAFTYTLVGVLFFISFPREKDCIQQVLLDNFPAADVMTFIARLFLLFQLTTVFPLAMYVIRVQFMFYFFKKTYPSYLHVFILNFVLIGTCVLFAVVYPHVGDFIRYAGSLSGVAYDYALPCIVYIVIQKQKGKLSWLSAGFHSIIVLLGFANLMAQFFTSA